MLRIVMHVVLLVLLIGLPTVSWSQIGEALCGKWLGGTTEEAEHWLACRKAVDEGRHPVQRQWQEQQRLEAERSLQLQRQQQELQRQQQERRQWLALEERRVRALEEAARAARHQAVAAEDQARAAERQAEAARARRVLNCWHQYFGGRLSTTTCE